MSFKFSARRLGPALLLAACAFSAPCMAVAPVVVQMANNQAMGSGSITAPVQLSTDVSIFTVYETANTVSSQQYAINVEVSPDNAHWAYAGTLSVYPVGTTTSLTVTVKSAYVRLHMVPYNNDSPLAYITASIVY